MNFMVKNVCGYISFAVQKSEREEDKVAVEERSFKQGGVSGVQSYCDGESIEMLTLFSIGDGREVFRDFLSYNTKRKVGSYAEGASISIAMPDQ